jgi:5'-methylthioadenosine phosphorylase
MKDKYTLGIIGGSGIYQFTGLTDVKPIEIETPFGKPSSPLITGKLAGKRVAFLARHGIGHFISPTEVNYLANIYAFKSLDIDRIVSISACGSLREDFAPGHVVIPDQLVDLTRSRKASFFEGGLVVHVGTADPYCPELSNALCDAILAEGGKLHRGGTLLTIEGPRFSTKGESNLFRSWGISIIGMTACPEAFLAREAEICYATMAHVTDYDVWHLSKEAVSVEMVVKTLDRNTQLAQKAITTLVGNLPPTCTCSCQQALKDAIITNRTKISPEARRRLDLLVRKYLP